MSFAKNVLSFQTFSRDISLRSSFGQFFCHGIILFAVDRNFILDFCDSLYPVDSIRFFSALVRILFLDHHDFSSADDVINARISSYERWLDSNAFRSVSLSGYAFRISAYNFFSSSTAFSWAYSCILLLYASACSILNSNVCSLFLRILAICSSPLVLVTSYRCSVFPSFFCLIPYSFRITPLSLTE